MGKQADGVPHVVILGGGFGGLFATRALAKAKVRITLLDRTNHHTFQPLLYQVATAGLNPADIAIPIRRILRKQKNVTVFLADVTRIDVANKRVHTEEGEPIEYDYLVVATGATHSYFGHPEFEPFAPGLKTVDEGLLIRQRIFMAFEEAERETDPDKRRALLTFVVVGAGPTGVEMSGAIAEISRQTLSEEFRNFDPGEAKILLVEGGPRVLSTYSDVSSERAEKQLEKLGVVVRKNARVTLVDAGGVSIGDERIPAKTVIWAAGVAASPLAQSLGVPLDKQGRVKVSRELSIPGHDEVFVVGDLAFVEQDGGGSVPGVAQGAMQGGVVAARNILHTIAKEKREELRYVDKGSMATIGRAAAVAEIGRQKLHGYLAWLAWLAIHIMFLIGFKNRVLVLLQWAWSYFTYDRGSRLIHGMVHPEAAIPPALPSMRGRELAPPAPMKRDDTPARASGPA
jgi:NADH dehydrogenase